MSTRDEHDALQQRKRDKSWERYADHWPDICDRYDVTAALVKGPAVLDVGCAQGLLLDLLGRGRPDVTRRVGLENWYEMLTEAQKRLTGQFELWLDEADDCPGKSAEFDTVVLGQVLEHVYDPQAAALEALRVLRRGGRLIVNVPANESAPHGNHVRVFTLESMQALFEGVEWQGWGRLHQFYYAWGEKL